MKRIRITHKTEYHYRTPVTFGPHQALLPPREGHDVHVESSILKVEPEAEVRWLRDIYGMMGKGQHGATHAWTEIYIPGAGWRGFDPTNNKFAGSEHVSVAVAREHEKASPLSGTWEGPSDAFDRMEVSVQVV